MPLTSKQFDEIEQKIAQSTTIEELVDIMESLRLLFLRAETSMELAVISKLEETLKRKSWKIKMKR